MNSVALPASSSKQALGGEADLVRRAARGDVEAFDELFRRHSSPAWRLAQAVAPDRDSAAAAFGEGMVKALRVYRGPRRGGAETAAFRPRALAGVYRAAVERAYEQAAAPAPTHRPSSNPEMALADAAFRSLPERWRAALWLSEVENMESGRIAEVLGVSGAVADQLILRARRGLAGRYNQTRREVPEHPGELLRRIALPIPADLAEKTADRWVSSSPERAAIFAPISGWLEERGVRPMAVAAGALIGLGLVGLGVVPSAGPVHAALGGAGTVNTAGSVPVRTCLGLDCPNPAAAGGGAFGLFGGPTLTASGQPGSGAGGATSATSGGSSSSGGYSSGSGQNSGNGNNSNNGNHTSSGGNNSTPPPPPPPSSGGQTLNLGPVGSVTVSGTSASASLLPTSSGSTATGSVGTCSSTVVGVTIDSTSLGCTSGATSSGQLSTTVTTVSSTLSGTTSGSLSTVTGSTSTVTTTTLPGGL